jgi:steroid-24-oyl-CoA synthetase
VNSLDKNATRLCGPGAPFELLDDGASEASCRFYRNAPRTLQELYMKASRSGSRVAATAGARHLTYGELVAVGNGLAAALQSKYGLQGGQRVGIVIGNRLEWLFAFVAVTSMGAVAVLLDPRRAPQEIASCLATTDCRVAIVEDALIDALQDLGYHYPLIAVGTTATRQVVGAVYLDSMAQPCPAGPLAPQAASRSEIVIAFTSGSAGVPKGVILDHRGLMTGVFNSMLGAYLTSARNTAVTRRGASQKRDVPAPLLISPLSHVGGYLQFLLMCVLGGRIILAQSTDIDQIRQLIVRERAQSIVGAPPGMILELLRGPDAASDLECIAHLGFHGSALQERLMQQVAEVLPSTVVGTGYGMTETNGSMCVTAGAELLARPSTSGPPLPTVDMKIIGEDGQQASAGHHGRIFVRGAMLMRGYCSVGRNQAYPQEGAWFETGDLGLFDSDGFLHVLDRTVETVHCNGKRISCGAAERIASHYSFVEEAVALSVTATDRPDLLVVVVVPSRNQSIDLVGIGQHLSHELDMKECTPLVIERSDLPRTLSGKVDRRKLRAALQESVRNSKTQVSHA